LQHQAEVPRNPASLMKLVTTTAALDLLGPAFTWRTPLFIEGSVRDGVLQGHVYLQGSGDPKMGVEHLWLLMRRLQGWGIQKIQGDIVLDRSAFALPPHDPASFDGEPLRPYNAAPDALLIGFKSIGGREGADHRALDGRRLQRLPSGFASRVWQPFADPVHGRFSQQLQRQALAHRLRRSGQIRGAGGARHLVATRWPAQRSGS
jgi:D-alanyl-D-alanine carboxypeptidase